MLGLSSSEIKIKVGAEKDCVQTVSVEWPASKVKEKIEAAFQAVQAHAKIPGFRPGKTPLNLVKENFKDTAYAHAQDDLLREGVAEAIKQKKLNAVQAPVIQSMDFNPDKPFHFEFHVEVSPQIKLVNYKGLKLTRKNSVPTEDSLEKALKEIVQSNARLVESKHETLEKTDFAVVDYEGFMNDKPIQGAKATNFLIDMAAPQMITGLAEGLVGAKTGEERSIAVKFPEDSPSKDLAGKDATFKVKLTAIKEKNAPTLDDEFAKDLGLQSVAELREKVKENMAREMKTASDRDLKNQIVDKLLEENKFMVPKSLVDRQAEYLSARQQERLERQGFVKDEVKKLLEERRAEVRAQAEKEVRVQYILAELAKIEKIEVREEEITSRITETVAALQGKEKVDMEKMLRTRYADNIQSDLRDMKVFELLIKAAKIKEDAGGS